MNESSTAATARHGDGSRLRDCVEHALEKYFRELNGYDADDVYALVLGEVEPPLLRVTLQYCGGNQSKAAALLGISRSTLRKKLHKHHMTL